MRRGALIACVAGLVALVAIAAPWGFGDRVYPASTAQPPPLFVERKIALKPNVSACMSDVTVESHSQVLVFRVDPATEPGPPVEVTLRWPGAVERQSTEAGYRGITALAVRLDPPAGPRLASVCFKNRGRVAVALYGADGARLPGSEIFAGDAARSSTTVGGRYSKINPVANFYEAGKHSIARRAPTTASRIAIFRPVGPWFVWLLGALFVVGIPAGLGWALLRAAGDDETDRA